MRKKKKSKSRLWKLIQVRLYFKESKKKSPLRVLKSQFLRTKTREKDDRIESSYNLNLYLYYYLLWKSIVFLFSLGAYIIIS